MSFRKRNNFLVFLLLTAITVIFTLPGCKEGTESSPVSALLTGGNANQTTVNLSDNEDAQHSLAGTVVSLNSSENLSNINVTLYYNTQLAGTTKTTADGQFYFSSLPPGLYELAITSSDNLYKSANYIVRILDDGTTQPASPIISLELTNPGTAPLSAKIEGEVLNSTNGAKLANINVELLNSNLEIVTTALTNSQGYFSFDKISTAETFTVRAGNASNFTPKPQLVTIRSDGVVSPKYLIISLSPSEQKYSISGIVKNQFNASVINVEVKIYNDSNLTSEIDHTYTTGAGYFSFDSLDEAKVYFVKVMAKAGSTDASEVYPVRVLVDGTTSPEQAEIVVSQSINLTTYSVSGKIFDAFSGGPLEYANISLENGNSCLSDKQGKFVTENLIPGKYTLTISKFGYEKNFGSFTLNEDGTTMPSTLSFPLLHSLKEGYGSIAGRYVDITSGNGVPGLYVRLYRWKLVTKSTQVIDYIDNNGVTHFKTVTETDYQYEPSVVLTSKSSSETGANIVPEFTGSFKLTHLEPGKYLVYMTNSLSEPLKTAESRGGYFTWDVPNKAADAGFKTEIRGLEVLAGQTTYWTNYEQEYK